MSRSAASSCALVNSGGDPFAFCPDSFSTLFLGAAMAIPGERDRSALSNPTQTGVKGLRWLEKILLCRTAARAATFSKPILLFFEICGPAHRRHPEVRAQRASKDGDCGLSFEARQGAHL